MDDKCFRGGEVSSQKYVMVCKTSEVQYKQHEAWLLEFPSHYPTVPLTEARLFSHHEITVGAYELELHTQISSTRI